MQQRVISILVDNQFGVLTKVSNLFSKRAFNIKALSSGETENPAFSRLTVLVEGTEEEVEQIYLQVSKLEVVKAALIIPPEKLVERELLLVKLRPNGSDAAKIMQLLTEYSAKATAAPDECVIIEASGRTQDINDLIEKLRVFGILELSRTGTTALEGSSRMLSEISVQPAE